MARLQKIADAERASLRRQRKIQRDAELDFEEEKVWVKRYLKAEEGGARPAVPEVVELSVGAIGERLTVRHSTLMLCPESALARQFDAEVWGAAATAGDDDDSDDSDDDDDDDGGVSIEADPYCFRKLVDQLRMRAIAEAGDPPPSPVVTKSKEDPFARLLDYYFPGELRTFVMSEGEHRHPGTKHKLAPMDALRPCGAGLDAALTFGRLPAGVQGLGTNTAAGIRDAGIPDGGDRCCVGSEVVDVGAAPVFWKAKLNAQGATWLGLGVCTFAQLPADGKPNGCQSAETWCWSSNGYNWPGDQESKDAIWEQRQMPAEQDVVFKLEHRKLTMRCGAQEQSMALPANQQYRVLALISRSHMGHGQSSVTLLRADPHEQF
eukprot:COSAG06_NODE_3_length_43832_cov_136.908399_10_plen_378_part_00